MGDEIQVLELVVKIQRSVWDMRSLRSLVNTHGQSSSRQLDTRNARGQSEQEMQIWRCTYARRRASFRHFWFLSHLISMHIWPKRLPSPCRPGLSLGFCVTRHPSLAP